MTRTQTQSYDGDGQIIYSSDGSIAGTYYIVRATALGGEVITRLTSTGEKGYTYVPAGGRVQARQAGTNYYGQPAVEWTHTDPLGVTEMGAGGPAAYDPLGNYAPLPPPPPTSGPMQSYGVYAPNYNWTPSSFTNANDLATGCLSSSGNPTSCSERMRERTNDRFVDNLPHEYQAC